MLGVAAVQRRRPEQNLAVSVADGRLYERVVDRLIVARDLIGEVPFRLEENLRQVTEIRNQLRGRVLHPYVQHGRDTQAAFTQDAKRV